MFESYYFTLSGLSDLTLVAAQVVGLDVRRVHSMYMHSHELPHLSGEAPVPPGLDELPTAIMAALYSQAPGLVLVLSRKELGASEYLLKLKGDKRPLLADKNTLRKAGENLLFNFLHSPDDQESAEQELSYLMGAEVAQPPRELPRQVVRLCAASAPSASNNSVGRKTYGLTTEDIPACFGGTITENFLNVCWVRVGRGRW